MAVKERSYVAANGLFSFPGVLVWILIGIGLLALVIGLANGGQTALVVVPMGLLTTIFGAIVSISTRK